MARIIRGDLCHAQSMAEVRGSEIVRPLAEAVDAYALAVQRSDPGLLLGTEATGEIAAEKGLHWHDETEPVATTHSTIRVGHFFVLDAYRSVAKLVTVEEPSVWGPFVVARSLLDAAGWVYWLSEPEIGVERRIQRRLALSVAEANAQRIPERPEFKEARDRLKKITSGTQAFCKFHGWEFRPRTDKLALRVGSESIPKPSRRIDQVVGIRSPEEKDGLGATLWWYLSSFTHGGMDGLLQAVERNPDPDPSTPSGNIMVRYDQFVWLLDACSRATIHVTQRRFDLMGGSTPEIEGLRDELKAQLAEHLRAVGEHRMPNPTPGRPTVASDATMSDIVPGMGAI